MPKDTKPKAEFTEEIDLTAEELAELSLKQAAARLECNRLSAEKAVIDADFRAKIAVLDDQQDVLAKEIDTHKRVVEIETKEITDEARKMVLTVRADNETIILKQREFTKVEEGRRFEAAEAARRAEEAALQPGLPLGEVAAATAPAEDTTDALDKDDAGTNGDAEPVEAAATADMAPEAEKPKRNGRRVPRDLPPEPEDLQ